MSSALAKYAVDVRAQLQGIARELSDAPTELMPDAKALLDTLEDWVEEQKRRVTEHLLMYASVNGAKVTDKGTLQAELGDFLVRAIPTTTQPDTDKVKALLFAKGHKDPTVFLEKKVTYKATRTTLDVLVAQGHFTQEEADSCIATDKVRLEVKAKFVPEVVRVEASDEG